MDIILTISVVLSRVHETLTLCEHEIHYRYAYGKQNYNKLLIIITYSANSVKMIKKTIYIVG